MNDFLHLEVPFNGRFHCCRASAVDENQGNFLRQLIDQGNPQVGKIFQQYEKDKDVYKLIAALKQFQRPVIRNLTSSEDALHFSPLPVPQTNNSGSGSEESGETYEDDFEEDVDEVRGWMKRG